LAQFIDSNEHKLLASQYLSLKVPTKEQVSVQYPPESIQVPCIAKFCPLGPPLVSPSLSEHLTFPPEQQHLIEAAQSLWPALVSPIEQLLLQQLMLYPWPRHKLAHAVVHGKVVVVAPGIVVVVVVVIVVPGLEQQHLP